MNYTSNTFIWNKVCINIPRTLLQQCVWGDGGREGQRTQELSLQMLLYLQTWDAPSPWISRIYEGGRPSPRNLKGPQSSVSTWGDNLQELQEGKVTEIFCSFGHLPQEMDNWPLYLYIFPLFRQTTYKLSLNVGDHRSWIFIPDPGHYIWALLKWLLIHHCQEQMNSFCLKF